jgi:GT2 family glycosyltransferase
MRLSLIIAAHNEGDCLARTVQSCVETCAGLDYEIVIADDASWDGSIEETQNRFPRVHVVRHEERKGASPTKDLGARNARGEVLVFLDGHTKPEPGAIERLVKDVELLKGEAVVTPAVAGLCPVRWKTLSNQVGHGYSLELERFDCGWVPRGKLRASPVQGRTFYESPALIGCALAIHRELYDDLRGFDPHMRSWGVEDLDFGLKCWLLGHPILHDPNAIVAHRFRKQFDNFSVPVEHLLLNQIRMARKNFTHGVWSEWLERCRGRHSGRLSEHPEGLWAYAWELFEEHRASVEAERAYLMSRRTRDEFWYAERFNLAWPRLLGERFEPSPLALGLMSEGSAEPSPSPNPPAITVDIDIEDVPDDKEETIGGVVVRRADGNEAPRKKITLDSTATTGNVILTRNNSKVKVFTEEEDGTEITFNGTNNKFPVGNLPKVLYVQGHEASGSMRDVTLQLTHDEYVPVVDLVKFTVLWVIVTAKHTGKVADDNSRQIVYFGLTVPNSLNLGYSLFFNTTNIIANSRSSEFVGTVSPSDFEPAQFGGEMRLNRDLLSGITWLGTAGDGTDQQDPDTPGNDLSPSLMRDDDPQSDDSKGKIYDLDPPGEDAFFSVAVDNYVIRLRVNFRAWADFKIGDADWVRSSEFRPWYTRQSYKKTGATDFGNVSATTNTTLTDNNMSWNVNEWTPGAVKIIAGLGMGQVRSVTANSPTTLVVWPDWDVKPGVGSIYQLLNNSTWSVLNDVAGDNQNGDGSTNISWDLQ